MKNKVFFITHAAVIAALYTVLTVFVAAFNLANGAIQIMEVRVVRLSDYKDIYTLNATKYMNRTKG